MSVKRLKIYIHASQPGCHWPSKYQFNLVIIFAYLESTYIQNMKPTITKINCCCAWKCLSHKLPLFVYYLLNDQYFSKQILSHISKIFYCVENEKFIWIFCQHLLKLSEKPSSAIINKYFLASTHISCRSESSE